MIVQSTIGRVAAEGAQAAAEVEEEVEQEAEE